MLLLEKKPFSLSFAQSYTHYPQKKAKKTEFSSSLTGTHVLCTTDSFSRFHHLSILFLTSDTIFKPLIIHVYNSK